MKPLIALALLLATALAFTENKPKTGNAALGQLQRQGDDVYVYLFTHKNGVNNESYRKFLAEELAKYPNLKIHYGELNMSDEHFKSFRDTIKIEDLKKRHPNDRNPTIFFMGSGNGEWIHGPQTKNRFRTDFANRFAPQQQQPCLLYTSPSPRDS